MSLEILRILVASDNKFGIVSLLGGRFYTDSVLVQWSNAVVLARIIQGTKWGGRLGFLVPSSLGLYTPRHVRGVGTEARCNSI